MEEKRSRLVSLDAFRGATVLGMLVVNNVALGGRTPRQLAHAPFGAWPTFADLVFPWFLLCAGIALPFSYSSVITRGMTDELWRRKAATRAAGLLVVGMGVDSAVAGRATLGLGVLQLIGLSSLGAACTISLSSKHRAFLAFTLLVATALALLIYRPEITEGDNLFRFLNKRCLQQIGLRGLPSVVPATALVLMGTIVGDAMRAGTTSGRVAVGGVLLALAGAAVHLLGLPMAKAIWTPSYICYTAGLGTVAIAFLAFTLDGRRSASWAAPLSVFGANPLFAYVFPILVKSLVLRQIIGPSGQPLPEEWLAEVVRRFGPVAGGWAYTAVYVAAVWIVLAVMRRRGWVVRL